MMRVVVAAPSPLLRAVLVAAFDHVDIEVVASVSSVADLLTSSAHHRPQVVVTTTGFPGEVLPNSVPRILRGSSRVLVVCEADTAEAAATLLLAGASGCLYIDDCGADEIVAAVRQVAAGAATLHPTAAAAVLQMWRAERSSGKPRAEPAVRTAQVIDLTVRETEVLRALAGGLPTKSIGRELGVSPKTVESHVARLLTKLGARNRAQAVALAEARGLLDGDQ